MTFIQSPAKVLLTGANGYFAVHAIKNLLDRGYIVVGTVRSETKGEELLKVFPSHLGKLSYVVVSNIVKAGAFDQVIIEGNFDAVAHTASPAGGGTIEDFVKPAVDGSIGILESIKTYGQNVKRVIVTSSAATVLTSQNGVQYNSKDGIKHNESHWNDDVIKLVEEQGNSSPPIPYFYSKTLAERAIWRWWSENQNMVKWDLATINPAYIMGAPMNAVTSRDQLTSTNAVLRSVLAPHEDLTAIEWPVVHVQDVVAIHSAIFEWAEDMSGRRVIIVGSEPSWQDIFDALSNFSGVPKGSPGVGTNPDVGSPGWDVSFARELLGREFIGTRDMFVETEEYYRKKGWSFFV